MMFSSLNYKINPNGKVIKVFFRLYNLLGFESKQKQEYWLTRFIFLRFLGLVYFVAFLILVHQVIPLIGENGLLPMKTFLDSLNKKNDTFFQTFLNWPSIFWFLSSDSWLLSLAWLGTLLSFLVLIGFANAPLLLFIWFLYLSFIHIGQVWYSFGWEIQLIETGFLAIFICPILDPRPFSRCPPPIVVIWLLRWLVFRILIGAALIKIRGDECWHNFTCLFYHYETQPIPNPLSPWFHFSPEWFHKFSAAWSFFSQLVLPWFIFGPRPFRHMAGLLLIFFQLLLILSGNLSFLNWLTITSILSCFDDHFFRQLLPKVLTSKAAKAAKNIKTFYLKKLFSWGLAVLVLFESIPVIKNLLSPSQVMNTSFNQLHLVNTYGAFGHVGKKRKELIIEGTSDKLITSNTLWKPYEFKVKPGNPNKPLPIISPYHYRIDWQIWFAAMSTPMQQPWLVHFVWKLLHNDPGALNLIFNNPFSTKPPEYIKIDSYLYKFEHPTNESGIVWNRRRLKTWLKPVSKSDLNLRKLVYFNKWKPPLLNTEKLGFATIEGFRSAKFGMSEYETKIAISKDFDIHPSGIHKLKNPKERTISLKVTINNLLLKSDLAEVLYTLNDKENKLVKIDVIWRNLKNNSNKKMLIIIGNILTRYFFRQGFEKNKIRMNFKLKDDSFLFFRGVDNLRRMINLILIDQKSSNKNKKPYLLLSYINKPNVSELFRINKGDF